MLTASFIDSGSNGLFFDDSSLKSCSLSKAFYCPAKPLNLSATVMAYDGSTSSNVTFTIEGADILPSTAVVGSVGGRYNHGNVFDWGLPFFFGRKVYVGLEGPERTLLGVLNDARGVSPAVPDWQHPCR